jgi:hypothetical protein
MRKEYIFIFICRYIASNVHANIYRTFFRQKIIALLFVAPWIELKNTGLNESGREYKGHIFSRGEVSVVEFIEKNSTVVSRDYEGKEEM